MSFKFDTLPTNKQLFSKIKSERAFIGYYNLPFQDLSYLKELDKFTQKNIYVIGIGGSSLGSFAIYNFLQGNNFQKNIEFLESTDPISINYKLSKHDLSDSVFVVISKSGNTLETLSIFKYIHSLININSTNCVVITGKENKLFKYAESLNLDIFDIPFNVGGRFSVLSAVGLVPLYLLGINIKELLRGAAFVNESFFNKQFYKKELLNKARFIAENKDKYNINAVFSYSELLTGFNKWFVQLWAESLGKLDSKSVNQGLTPIGLIGPNDQHSFLQLIMEGKRDKTVTFIKIKDFNNNILIPRLDNNHFDNLTAGNSFSEIINLQIESTIGAVKENKDIPVDVIELNNASEFEIGKLIFYYQLLTSLVGNFLGIKVYNQPGVEVGKRILQNKLIKRAT